MFMNVLHQNKSSLTKLNKCLWIWYIRSLFETFEQLFMNMLHQIIVGLSWINVYEYVTSDHYCLIHLNNCLWICYIRINPVWLSWINVCEFVTSDHYCLIHLNNGLWICYIRINPVWLSWINVYECVTSDRINPVWLSWINAYEYDTSDHCLRLLNNCLWICYIRSLLD
jgi:hypothetical protein